VQRPGEVVSQKEFQEKVWPGSVVGDVNLRVQITALRKLLAEDSASSHGIRSITGRGYCFVGPVTYTALRNTAAAETLDDASNDISNLIGRRTAIEDICRLLSTRGLVSIVGPGGIGKSAAALVAVRAFNCHRSVMATMSRAQSHRHLNYWPTTVRLSIR
jgi:Transcriptional regulatory protein, C terminal